jgi:hypothetical protein
MSKKKPASGKQTSVRVGNISDIKGNVNVAGGDMTTYQITTGLSGAEIKQLFNQIYTNIEARPQTSSADKEELKAEVKEIEATVNEVAQKNEKVDEGFLSRSFRNIARIAPDVLDVVVAALANPALGIGTVVKKIAERAKQDTTQI